MVSYGIYGIYVMNVEEYTVKSAQYATVVMFFTKFALMGAESLQTTADYI